MKRTPPLTFAMSAVPWRVFGTLTFRAEVSEQFCLKELQRFLRWTAHVSRVKYNKLMYLSRLERGERFGRVHLHILIGEPVSLTHFVLGDSRFVSAAHREWRNGLTRFRGVEDNSDPAVAYLLKELSGSDAYELNKTGRANDVGVAPRVFFCANIQRVARRRGGHVNPVADIQSQALGKTARLRTEEPSSFTTGGKRREVSSLGMRTLGHAFGVGSTATETLQAPARSSERTERGSGVVAPVTKWIETLPGLFVNRC